MRTDARHRLEALLDAELGVVGQLSELLLAERAALTGDAPEAVHELAARKVALLARLEEFETNRRHACSEAAIDLPPPAGSDPHDGPTARWHVLMELIARCRRDNEVNGYIINVRRHQLRELLDLVRGGQPAVYGPQGRTAAKAQRALARA